MEMEEKPVEIIRQSTRDLLNLHRRIHRDLESDFRRFKDDYSTTSADDITDIANKLKTRSVISLHELQTLRNGVLDDPAYIEVVLNTSGALRGIVRELSGRDVKKQCAAASCCCNLSLGDSKAALAVAKAAGPYLIAALDSLTLDLIVPCAWALGNIAGSSLKACELLIAQGAMFKLTAAVGNPNDDVRDSAVYALLLVAYQMKDEMGVEYVGKIIDALSTVDLTMQSSQLIFVLTCHKDFRNCFVNRTLITNILRYLCSNIQRHLKSCPPKNCCVLIYVIRILANLHLNDELYTFFILYFMEHELCDPFKLLLGKIGDVRESLLWLLGNLYNHKTDNEFVGYLLM